MPVHLEDTLATGVLQPYLTVRTRFTDNAGVPLSVKSVVFEVVDPDTGQAVSVTQHHPPYANYPDTGWVQADIDTTTLQQDKSYTFRFTVELENGQTAQKESTVTMYGVSRRQWLIDTLRTALLDKPTFTTFVPYLHQRYLIRKPWELEWQNEELNTYLELALLDINNAPPPTLTFSLESCPATNFLITGGVLHAVQARILVEYYNYFETNAPVQVRVQKGDRLSSFYSLVEKNYVSKVEQWKKAYSLYMAKPLAAVLTRLPFTVIRPLSMMYGYGNLYQW